MSEKTKPEPRFADHKLYGRGQILTVRELDSGGDIFVAEVKFEDVTRTIRLLPEYWRSSILSLIPKPEKRAPVKRKSVRAMRVKELGVQAGAA